MAVKVVRKGKIFNKNVNVITSLQQRRHYRYYYRYY